MSIRVILNTRKTQGFRTDDIGCAIVDETYYYDRVGGDYEICTEWRNRAIEHIRVNRPDVVFVGSCTNSRLSDLEMAASVLKGRKVADGVRMLVVPGSQQIKKDAEARGLDKVFVESGAEWRESGCSMCLGMNGDTVPGGQLSVSTSNRNFEGRQGIGARTVLASPLTAAASAIEGRVADPRPYLDA